MEKDVCIIAEGEGNSFGEISYELACEGGRLAKKTGGRVRAIILGGDEGLEPESLIRLGVDQVTWLRPVDEFHAVSWDYLDHLKNQIEEDPPALLLAGMTPTMGDILAPLAIRLHASLFTNVHFINLGHRGAITVTRPFCEGKASVQETGFEGKLAIVAVPTGIFNVHSDSNTRKGEVKIFQVESGRVDYPRRMGLIPADPNTIDISEAERIVSAGEGVGSAEHFKKVCELAEAIGAAVAGSRKACDRKWITRERQIGQTGKEVKPKIIIACGISGAIAHVSRMQDAEKTVVINTDKHAPLFRYADLGVVGDLRSVIPELIKLIRESR
ncbi:MAG: electron transfer flavoprotein subunit alpha/FixB family protein [Pseudomonadota bacterium]